MTQGDDSSKVPAIGMGTPRTRPAEGVEADPATSGVSPLDRPETTASPAAAEGLSAAAPSELTAGADAITGLGETGAVDATTRLAGVTSIDAVTSTEGDVAIAAALRTGTLDRAGALERIVDEVIRSQFSDQDSPELRATLMEAFASDPMIAALLTPE